MKFGSTDVSAVMFGSAPVLKVIFNSQVVWEPGSVDGMASLLIQFEDETAGSLEHRIYADGILAVTLAAGDTEHTLTGLEWNTEYEISIYSWDGLAESNELEAFIWTAPELPPSITLEVTGENSIQPTIIPPSPTPASLNSGTGYSVEQSPNGTTGWAVIELVPVGDQPAEVTGLSGDTPYYYRARSVNGNPSPHDPGRSYYSAVVNATTDADVTIPTNSAVSATAGDTVGELAATSSETGTRYWFISTSATPPSVSDLKAGTGAVYASNEACTAATPCTQTATGLSNGTTYYLHTVATDAALNDSTIATTAGFVPAIAAPEPDLLWWKLNDGSGTAIDAAVGPDGTTDAAWVTGKSGSGYALDFDGSTDDAATNSALTFGTDIITVCAWIYSDSNTGVRVLAESSANFNSVDHSWILTIEDGVINALIKGGTGGPNYRGETVSAPATGSWYHLAVVFDNSTTAGNIRIFLDAVEQSTTVSVNSKNSGDTFSAQTVYLGARASASNFIDGKIDDFRIYAGDVSADIADIVADPQ